MMEKGKKKINSVVRFRPQTVKMLIMPKLYSKGGSKK